MEEKTDLRIRKTYKALCDAFVTILEKKRFDDLTVNELCDEATIRRATFYKHFADKHDFFPFYSLQRYHFLLVSQQQAYNIMKNRRAMLQNIIFSYLCVQLDEKIDSKTLQNGKNNQRNGFALS